jgi:hypothetical protein
MIFAEQSSLHQAIQAESHRFRRSKQAPEEKCKKGFH